MLIWSRCVASGICISPQVRRVRARAPARGCLLLVLICLILQKVVPRGLQQEWRVPHGVSHPEVQGYASTLLCSQAQLRRTTVSIFHLINNSRPCRCFLGVLHFPRRRIVNALHHFSSQPLTSL